MVEPAGKRQVVAYLMDHYRFSERTACRLIGFSRSVNRYSSCRSSDDLLCAQLKRLSLQYPTYGYLMLHDLLRAQGLVINKKRTYRLYRREGLQIRAIKQSGLRCPELQRSAVPERVTGRWSLDFGYDKLVNGRYLRVLNLIDDFSKEMIGQLALCSVHGYQVAYYIS